MKKGMIGKVVAILCVFAIVLVGAFIAKTNAVVSCEDCGGYGYVHALPCADCSGAGAVDGEDCGTCEGAGAVTIIGLAEDEAIAGGKTACETCAGTGEVAPDSGYYSTFMGLFPPLVAIALALITKEVYSSLFIGILLGGLLTANWHPVAALDNLLNDGLISAVSGTAGIFIFLVILGAMVALVNHAGGSAAFGRWAETHIKTRVGAAIATFILGVLIFIDDYFNCLTVGSVMRPVTDRHKISRAKLAFIIDATAAPICMIAPVSSWAAAVSEFTKGTGYSGIELFVRAIPYNFYSILTLVFVVAIAVMKFDYGPMKKHEFNAMHKGDLFTSGEKAEALEKEAENSRGRVIDLVLPVLVLVTVCVIGLIYVGGFFDGESFINAFGNTDATVGLPWGALVALVITIIYLMARKLITFKEAMQCIPKGFIAMVPAILILTFATALKNMTGLLGADVFVGGLMDSAAAGLANFLPAIIFLVACVLAFATGTSWGTFGILIPIVAAIFPGDSELLIIGMSACLAGAVCGDHCSPISDTTIMSSAGAQCNHLNHVSTQMPYAITVAAVSFVMYLLAAFIQSAAILLPIGVVLMLGMLFAIRAVTKKQQVEE